MADNRRAVETKAAPTRVWEVWSDTSTWPSWNPDMEVVSLDGPFKSGTTGTMRTKSGGTHKIVLEDVREGKAFRVNSDGMPATRLHFRCEIAARGEGSEVSQAVTFTGPLAWLMGGMARGQIVKTFPTLLEGLARYAEGTAKT